MQVVAFEFAIWEDAASWYHHPSLPSTPLLLVKYCLRRGRGANQLYPQAQDQGSLSELLG